MPLRTVAEAAARLGVTEQKLRRLLARPEHAGRTVSRTHRTQTGTRRAAMLPEGFIGELAALLERERNRPGNTPPNTPGTETEHSEHSGEASGERAEHSAGVFTGEAPGPLVRALIGQYEARISELTAALEHEREQSRTWREAHHRAQTLLALAAPVPDVAAQAQDSPQEAPQDPQASESGEVAAEAGQGENVVADDNVSEQSRRRSWWPFGRRKEA